ncbi:MAG: hypothetical protein QOD99_1922 [Chthoniobacter sp.]|jgi:hypothetical protein|nr:hypothetical protein [Chthoniobacter sp.]
MRLILLLFVLAQSSTNLGAAETEGGVVLTSLPGRVRIEVDAKPFTEYIFTGARRPFLYPILMPDGVALSRDFPMKEPPGEDHDHPHHRSLWFAHGSVNGIDFWNEGSAGGSTAKGTIVHDAFLETTSGTVGVIRARNRWLDPDGKLVCTDETLIRIRGASGYRMIDYEVTLHALPNEPLLLGDNKDGAMAIRLAQWMTMTHKIGKQELPGSGHIVTSTGKRDAEAWGVRADWCEYHAPKAGKTYGVAIFDHPQNPRHPTWWMARDYGLFAANPFGQHDFENRKEEPHVGDYTIPADGSLTLRYRFVFHFGDEKVAHLAELSGDYAKEK